MRASWSTLPHQLRIAGIALLASWTTVLSWRVLTEDFGEVAIPLLLIGVVLAGAGALARWSRLPGLAIVAGQLVLGGLLVLGTTTGSPIPTPSNVDTFMAALSDALETSRSYAAPVQSGVPPVHPLLLIGGTLVVLLVDLIACTMRRAPVAGLVLLAAYTLPVAVTGDAVSWWLFAVIAGLFLTLVFIQHSDHVTSWGRAPDGEKGSFSVRTGAIGNTALALGATAIALAVVVPVAVPTMSMSVFEGNGPGTREVEVQDPMVDLRRDLRRGEDIPLLWVTTLGPRPTYLRISVLSRFSGVAVDARGSRDPRVAGRDRRAAPARRRGPRRAAPRVQVRRARRAGLRVDVAAHRGADDADRGRQRLALRPRHPRLHRRPRGHHDGRQHLRLHGCPARATTPTG